MSMGRCLHLGSRAPWIVPPGTGRPFPPLLHVLVARECPCLGPCSVAPDADLWPLRRAVLSSNLGELGLRRLWGVGGLPLLQTGLPPGFQYTGQACISGTGRTCLGEAAGAEGRAPGMLSRPRHRLRAVGSPCLHAYRGPRTRENPGRS